MTSQRSDLFKLLEIYLPKISYAGGTAAPIAFPEFDLMPDEYLRFAEKELERGTDESRINCVSHLKRAIDCELDTFFHILSIGGEIKKRNLKFATKMDLVRGMGVVSPRSLTKLNFLRNRLEHEYAIPDFKDIEVFFDLAAAFISMIEGYIHMFVSNSEMQWTNEESDDDDSFWLETQYSFDSRSVTFRIGKNAKRSVFTFKFDDIEDYVWGMKLHFMLCRGIFLVSTDWILSEIRKEEANLPPAPTAPSGRASS